MKVYHAKNPTFGIEVPGMDQPLWPKDYVYVASVPAASTIDEAFVLTNTIQFPWFEGTFVQPAKDGKTYRSTSVGDVIEDNEGKFFEMKNIGSKSVAELSDKQRKIIML